MSLAIVHSRALVGIQALPVSVEVHLTNGLPALSIVGLPEAAVRESKDRVRSAIINSNFEFPRRKITINLAPADLPKEGGRYDLAIALGILAASEQIPKNALAQTEFLGELALSGELRAVSGVLPASIACQTLKHKLCVAKDNAEEAALPNQAIIIAGRSLLDVCHHLSNKADLRFIKETHEQVSPSNESKLDLNEVKGQERAKRALEIAAAGSHNLLFIGPPGTGKTMLATRLATLLPPLSDAEAIEVASIYSIHQRTGLHQQWKQRPCRAPHHTASAVALVGGGANPKPGEISLAHNGILFLDEFPEFDRKVLEVLREPLESGQINISRAARQVNFPANFQLIAAMNPCPCGYYGGNSNTINTTHKRCSCTLDQVQRYRAKLSGPLLDRIDLHVEVPMLNHAQFLNPQKINTSESSQTIRKRVLASREQQLQRQQGTNASLNNQAIEKYCQLNEQGKSILNSAMESLSFSPRAYHRILRVARSIADLELSTHISEKNIAEAISFRSLDRK